MAKKKKKSKSTSKTKSKSSGAVNLSEVQDLIRLMKDQSIAEFSYESNGEKLSIKTNAAFPAPIAAQATQALATAQPVAAAPQPESATKVPVAEAANNGSQPSFDDQSHKKILSPFVGTFYRSASPESDPYVREGVSIKPGDTLCIVEAMKLMNEIQSEFSGKITSVLVENGQPVEFGEPLFIVEV